VRRPPGSVWGSSPRGGSASRQLTPTLEAAAELLPHRSSVKPQPALSSPQTPRAENIGEDGRIGRERAASRRRSQPLAAPCTSISLLFLALSSLYSASFPGPSPLRLRNRAPVCGLTRPPLLKVSQDPPPCYALLLLLHIHACRLQVAKPQSFVRPRFVQASRRIFTAATSSGRQGLRTSQYQFDDDEPLWLAVVREFAA
jgi:hypothetical protein